MEVHVKRGKSDKGLQINSRTSLDVGMGGPTLKSCYGGGRLKLIRFTRLSPGSITFMVMISPTFFEPVAKVILMIFTPLS
jgi:hypothetical protein